MTVLGHFKDKPSAGVGWVLLVGMVLFLWQSPTLAAESRMNAVRTSEAMVLDGLFNEKVWAEARATTDFRQREPAEGKPATEETQIRLVYDDKALYIGTTCHDSKPSLIVSKEMRRDGDIEGDDNISIVIDTYLDHRNAYYFAVNTNGARKDALVTDEGDGNNLDWNGVWDVRTIVTENGWQAEIMIPFDTLRFKGGPDQVWGLNVRRMIGRKNEEVLWQAYRRNAGLLRISEAGLLAGIEGIKRSHRYEVRPYLAFSLTESPAAGGSETDRLQQAHEEKVGFDAKVKLAENLTADLTVNTDFGQTEVDRQVVNLTRFPIRFPEKREFFQENAGFFDFASGEDTQLFWSRRIGLSEGGQPIPIDFGGRVTGKLGRFDVGFLNAQTRGDEFTPAANFTVFRPKFGILRKSYIGGIFNNVYNARDGNRNQTYGIDSNFSFSEVFGQNVSISSSLAQTRTPQLRGDNLAGHFNVTFPNDWLEGIFNYDVLQKNFNPELGFLERNAFEHYGIKVRFQPRPPAPWNRWIRQLFIKPLEVNWFNSLPQRELESLEQEFRPLGAEFQSGDSFEFNIIRHFDRLDEDFDVFSDVVIPRGRYWWNSYELQFESASKRRWQLDGATSWGGYYNGHLKELELEGGVKLTQHLSLGGDYIVNRASFLAGRFTTHEIGSRVTYAFSNRANLQVFSQWNNESRRADVYVRLHIIPKIGSDIYGVFNQLLNTAGGRHRNAGRAVRSKIVYPFYY